MAANSSPKPPNTLGGASLVLSILSLSLVFGIGLCALVGVQLSWIRVAGTPLFVRGATSAFLGLIGVVLGLGGLPGANRPRAASIAGLVLGLWGVCLFLAVLGAIGRASGR